MSYRACDVADALFGLRLKHGSYLCMNPYLVKYFTKQGERWCLKDQVKRMVQFRPMNLVQAWPTMPPMDLIFIRNVMIYFDVETKKQILRRIRNCLRPDGYLFLGTAETTTNLDLAFQPVTVGKAVVYRALPGPIN